MKTDYTCISKWLLPEPVISENIANCSLNLTLQKVLMRRRLKFDMNLDAFINPSQLPEIEDHFPEIVKATERIKLACERKEKIAICGDYDADGITSTVLLLELLNCLGANAVPYIPSRSEDGYGLNNKMIERIYNNGIRVAITVDNGIAASQAINKARNLDIDLIITDHHKIPDKHESVYALIHPEKAPNESPYKYLAGVGIAYMLAKFISRKTNFNLDNVSAKELFCIGTVADMAPLLGANRIWLKEFLPKINYTNNKGLKNLLELLRLNYAISTDDIGYKIAPLINAVGRIGDPNLVIDLFTNQSDQYVNELSKECIAINNQRRKMTETIVKEAIDIANNELHPKLRFLVVVKSDWHLGIIGIVAARLLDKYNIPTAIISEGGDGLFRGSIRSNENLKVNNVLKECNELLESYGGHAAAAGFTVKNENLQLLKNKLNQIALRELPSIDFSKVIKPDANLVIGQINKSFFEDLEIIGPFGMKNPAPIFWSRKCRICQIFKLKGGHSKLKIEDDTGSIYGIKWNNKNILNVNDLVDIAFYIELNKWNNKDQLQLNIIDIKKYSEISYIHVHNKTYKCHIDNDNIIITNQEGNTVSSENISTLYPLNTKKGLFARKMLSIAEIALGKAA